MVGRQSVSTEWSRFFFVGAKLCRPKNLFIFHDAMKKPLSTWSQNSVLTIVFGEINPQKFLPTWYWIQIMIKEKLGVHFETLSGKSEMEFRIEANFERYDVWWPQTFSVSLQRLLLRFRPLIKCKSFVKTCWTNWRESDFCSKEEIML